MTSLLLLFAGCSAATNTTPLTAPDAEEPLADAAIEEDAAQLDAAFPADAGVDAFALGDSGTDAGACELRRFNLGRIEPGESRTREVNGGYVEVCISWDEESISSRSITIGMTVHCMPCVIPPVTEYCFPYEPGEIVVDNTHCATDSCGAQTAMEDVVVEVRCAEDV